MKLYSHKEKKCVDGIVFEGDKMFVDCETTSLSHLDGRAFMISFSDMSGNAYALDLREWDEKTSIIFSDFAALCRDSLIEKIGWNIKFDIAFLKNLNVDVVNVVDAMILARLENNRRKSYKLKEIVVDVLNRKIDEKKELDKYLTPVKKVGDTNQTSLFGARETLGGFENVPFDVIAPYAAADVILTRDMFVWLIKKISDDGLNDVAELEKRVLAEILKIEQRGFAIDASFILSEQTRVESELAELKKEIFHEIGSEINLLSNDDVGDLLFNKLGLVSDTMTDTGKPQITKFTLEKLENQNALVGKIKAFRNSQQYLSTFLVSLLDRQVDGVIYAEFNQLNAKTGRMSSSNPNMQNIPARDEKKSQIRRAFVPRSGYVLMSADYSQIEYRLFAHYVENKFLLDAYANDHDFHEEVARQLFNVAADKPVDDLTRRKAKDINFGLLYGMGKASLASRLKVSTEQASKIFDDYFARFPETKRLKWRISDVIVDRGFIKSIYGRRAYMTSDETYKGLNALIQGSAADVFKLALRDVGEYIKDKDVHIINLVHDELVFEIKDDADFILKTAPEIKKILESVVSLRVPVRADFEIGSNWDTTETFDGTREQTERIIKATREQSERIRQDARNVRKAVKKDVSTDISSNQTERAKINPGASGDAVNSDNISIKENDAVLSAKDVKTTAQRVETADVIKDAIESAKPQKKEIVVKEQTLFKSSAKLKVSNVLVDEFTAHVSKAFDYDFTGESSFQGFEKPELPSEFNIGLIVGASGSGKSTLLSEFGAEEKLDWDPSKAVVSHFSDPNDAVDRLSAVGFNSIPSWVKPFHVLSNGEKFRSELARRIKDGAVIDEFTSVVDRNVAKATSNAIAKFIRRRNFKSVVFASCHHDIIEWLAPDWVFDCDVGKFYSRGSIRRPQIDVRIYDATAEIWSLFARHHYLSADLSKAAKCFVGIWENQIIAFASVLPLPSGTVKNAWREHRTVVLPDFQGLGIGTKFSDAIAQIQINQGRRYYSRTAHVRFAEYRRKSKLWRESASSGKATAPNKNLTNWKEDGRICFSFEYIGKAEKNVIASVKERENEKLF